jgi:H+-transporting ATPase
LNTEDLYYKDKVDLETIGAEDVFQLLQSTHDSLAPKAKVKRDAKWIEIEAFHLVPGDMISFKIGNIAPADCRLTESVNVSIGQAALTGESLPQNKKECFS